MLLHTAQPPRETGSPQPFTNSAMGLILVPLMVLTPERMDCEMNPGCVLRWEVGLRKPSSADQLGAQKYDMAIIPDPAGTVTLLCG